MGGMPPMTACHTEWSGSIDEPSLGMADSPEEIDHGVQEGMGCGRGSGVSNLTEDKGRQAQDLAWAVNESGRGNEADRLIRGCPKDLDQIPEIHQT
ncbi:hypothetical protein AX15_007883 [Amanita polypyramis BW_CC]|nr:hypothetical protein AX15_007883 [Amanita polypyramis BW_CC]